MRKNKKLIYGVAVNDSGRELASITKDGKYIMPHSYKCWHGIIERCYSKKLHERYPTYSDCRVYEGWLNYSVFEQWYLNQYKEDKWALDKDIIKKGNKIYGPDTCVFVSQQLNNFFNSNKKSRGNYKIGVTWSKLRNKFLSHCSNPFTKKLECLGEFFSENQAHEAWRKRKHELACLWADQVEDERIVKALKTRFSNEAYQ